MSTTQYRYIGGWSTLLVHKFNVEESINPRNRLLAMAVCKVGDEVVGHMPTLVSSAVFHYLLGVTELFQ